MVGIGPSGQRGQPAGATTSTQGGQHIWVGFPQGHGVPARGCRSRPTYAPTSSIRSSTNISATAITSGSAGWATRRGCCRWSARSFLTRRTTAASRARSASGIRTARTETEGWRFFLVDADAPAEVKDVLRRYYMRYSGPAGMTEQDDMENWQYATAASRGTIARRYPFNYQLSMGTAQRSTIRFPATCPRRRPSTWRATTIASTRRYLNGGDVGRTARAARQFRAAAE